MTQYLTGLFLGIVISFLAYRLRALSRSGAVAAAVCGGIIFGFGGLSWAILLMTFFISSSALSRAFSRYKTGLSEKFSKGSQRDWGQVIANGGLGALLVLLHNWLPEQPWLWIAFAGAMAAVNADTWATELGVLNPDPPRLITNGKIVERGASGGISWLGSLAALGGAGLVAILATFFPPQGKLEGVTAPVLLIAVMLGGLAGSFFDSFLGATFQAIYFCPACQKETERHPHHLCGSVTRQIRGWRWLDNDLVNLLASLAGTLAATGIGWLLS